VKRVHIIIVYSPDGLTERYRLHFTSERKAREYTLSNGFEWNGGFGLMRNTLTNSLACYTVHPLH